MMNAALVPKDRQDRTPHARSPAKGPRRVPVWSAVALSRHAYGPRHAPPGPPARLVDDGPSPRRPRLARAAAFFSPARPGGGGAARPGGALRLAAARPLDDAGPVGRRPAGVALGRDGGAVVGRGRPRPDT